MATHTVFAGYRQFYVADAGLEPSAPEEWSDEHIQQRFNAEANIVALCPEGDITARVKVIGPHEKYESEATPEFEVLVHLQIVSGQIGVFGWPWEPLEKFEVEPGQYLVRFTGYELEKAQSNGSLTSYSFYIKQFT